MTQASPEEVAFYGMAFEAPRSPSIGDRVEVIWLDITEHHDVRDGDEKDTGPTDCVSWGILLEDNDDVLKIMRERRGDTKDVQAFPRGCVTRVTLLEPVGARAIYDKSWTVSGEGHDTTQTGE